MSSRSNKASRCTKPDDTASRGQARHLAWATSTAVRDGLVDAAFVWLPADTGGLHTEVVALEQRMVGLAADHRLAERSSVSIMDLRTEPVMWTSKAPKPWVDWWAVNPRPDGSEPVWGPQNDNVEEMLEQVAGALAICIGSSSMATYYARPDLVWLPITDIEPLRIAFAYPVSSTNPLVAAFAAVIRELSDDDSAIQSRAAPST